MEIAMNCDRIARYYQFLEYATLGRALERRRFAYLAETKRSVRALLCGGGDGRFLEALLRSNPDVVVDYAEMSAGMLRLAKARIVRLGPEFTRRVRFYQDDLRRFRFNEGQYDLIATHFFLDCFDDDDLSHLVSRLAERAELGAQWIVSEFREADGSWGRLWTGAVIRTLYAAFHIVTNLKVQRLPDYEAVLREAGFQAEKSENALGGLLQSSLWRTRPLVLDSSFGRPDSPRGHAILSV